jgi:16S rRNA (adenine1518-N6/adenine1519-N6)-dimethyltransferase
MAETALAPLREVLTRHGIVARKSLGQNFLLDSNLLARIARAVGDIQGLEVVEIGAGPGGLTRALIEAGARAVAIERDERCVAALEELADPRPGTLRVIAGDARTVAPWSVATPPVTIVGNLPFNVATPLIVGWLARPDLVRSMTLMVQREVADRLIARPNTKDYGRLAILAQWRWRAARLFDVAPRAFLPPPRVTASVVGLTPLPAPVAEAEPAALERVTAAAFGQRRKMLRSALKSLGVRVEVLLEAAGIEPTLRAEALDVAAFCALARALGAQTPQVRIGSGPSLL